MAGLIMLVALSVFLGATGDEARLHVAAVINENWRGTYDILVRPPADVLRQERTYGLVERNFLGIGGSGGISLAQWHAIQSLPDVDVAAPIASVGFLGSFSSQPTVEVPYPHRPSLYRLKISVTTSDGVRTLRVAAESGLAFIRPPRHAGQAPELSSTFIDYSGDNSPRGVATFTVSRFPSFPGLVVAVDPESEDALLGRPAFERLASTPQDGLLNTSEFPLTSIPGRFEVNRTYILIRRKSSAGAYPGTPPRPPAPVVPMVLNRAGTPPAKITWKVWRIGNRIRLPEGVANSTPAESLFPRIYRRGLPAHLLIARTIALPHMGLPLTPASLLLASTGQPTLGGGIRGTGDFSGSLALRPTYTRDQPSPLAGAPSFRVSPLGFAAPAPRTDPTLYHSYRGSGLPVSFRGPQPEQTYRGLVQTTPGGSGESDTPSPLDQPYYIAPVGSFDIDRLHLPVNPLNYAPLGAYDPADTQVLDGGSVGVHAGTEVSSTFDAQGFIVAPPSAFTTMGAAQLLKGHEPIDAIRVRISGLTSFDAASEARVASVVAAIRTLGLHADVVAGASPRKVAVYVPEYLGTKGHPIDLGWVVQHWTSLGAAADVSTGLSRLTWVVVAMGFAAAVVFAFSSQALAVRSHSREISLLRAVGWRWSDIRRSLLIASTRVAVLVAGAGLLAAALARSSSHQASIWWGPLALGAVWIAATPLALRRAKRILPLQGASAGDIGRRRVPSTVSSLPGFSLRQATARTARMRLQVVSIGIGTACLVVVILLLRQAGTRAGPTALAEFTVGSVRPLHLAILAAGFGLLLTTVAAQRATDLASRVDELRALRAMGWPGRGVRRSLRFEGAILGAISALLGGLLATVLAVPLHLGVAAPVVAGFAVVLIGGASSVLNGLLPRGAM